MLLNFHQERLKHTVETMCTSEKICRPASKDLFSLLLTFDCHVLSLNVKHFITVYHINVHIIATRINTMVKTTSSSHKKKGIFLLIHINSDF